MRRRSGCLARLTKVLMAAVIVLVIVDLVGSPAAILAYLHQMEGSALQMTRAVMRSADQRSRALTRARPAAHAGAHGKAGRHVAAPAPCAPGDFATRIYTDGLGRKLTYYLYVPCNYDPARSYPLVLLLHGGGEIGSSANSAAQNRSLLLSRPYVQVWRSLAIQERWPCFVVVPQLVDGNRWVDVPTSQGTYHLARQPTTALLLAVEIVESVQGQYQGIDPLRLYITGISSGGYGVWDAIERWPQMFAAAVPVAGAGDPSKAAGLAALPIWAFRGAEDGYVSDADVEAMIQAIREAGGQPRYTEIPNAGHEIWVQVYTSRQMLSWLFSQHIPIFTTARPGDAGIGRAFRQFTASLALGQTQKVGCICRKVARGSEGPDSAEFARR
jgi:poly(3-hydroxybutyrate) depolymerase